MSLLKGILAKLNAGGGDPLAISGTEQVGETLTASGGTPPYAWYNLDPVLLIGSDPTLVIPPSSEGDVIQLTDATMSDFAETGVIAAAPAPEMPATLLEYWAEDYDAVYNIWPNRGSLGALGDLSLVGTAPTKGTDATGPYVDFNGTTGYLATAASFNTGYAGNLFTVYALFDVAATNGFVFDFQRLSNRITFRSETTRLRILDSAYRDYDSPAPGNTLYGAYVLDGGTPEARGYDADGVADSNNPNTYVAQVIDLNVNMTIGALNSGSTPFAGKIRAVSIASALHDATTRGDAAAAHEEVWTLP